MNTLELLKTANDKAFSIEARLDNLWVGLVNTKSHIKEFAPVIQFKDRDNPEFDLEIPVGKLPELIKKLQNIQNKLDEEFK